ncbi:MAG: DUF4258 domain-containing protein [bacterium]|nr:MAG: DUF4258 domain-containing protein [bacterium]
MAIIDKIREKLKNGEYKFAIPHFFEEMAEDDLTFADIKQAINNRHIRRKFSRNPRGRRYEIVGKATTGQEIAVICRIKSTGKLLFITTYALE